MAALDIKSTKSPSKHSQASKVLDMASTTLEAALTVLEVLSSVTKNVPYLSTITGCIQELMDIQKSMAYNKERAAELLTKIGEISRDVGNGLRELGEDGRNAALMRMKDDLKRYKELLRDTCTILTDWTSQRSMKRLLSHEDFKGITNSIDRRLDAFRDAFSVSRLIALSIGQGVLDGKIQFVVDHTVRTNLERWLQPASVAVSQRDAANKRHRGTGNWLFERSEFIEWIYAPSSLLCSTIVSRLRAKAFPVAFFYFDTNKTSQRTVTQLLCSLVNQLSVKGHPPDNILNALYTSHNNGQHLPSNADLHADALLPILCQITEPVYVILDALDESSELDDLLRWITDITNAQLLHVHILLTSRPEVFHTSTHLAERAVQVSLKGSMDQDIDSYVTERLSNFEIGWNDDRKEQIKRGLLERGGGMFRLIALQLDELYNCDGRESQVAKALSNMPTSLDTIYDRILLNIKDPEMLINVGRTMNWLIFSSRPMALREIIDALAFDFNGEPLRFNMAERMRPKALLAACGGFVTLSKEDETDDAFSEEDAEDDAVASWPRLQLAHASEPRRRITISVPYSLELMMFSLFVYFLLLLGLFGLATVPRVAKKPDNRQSHDNSKKELIDQALLLLQQDSAQFRTLCRLYNFDEQRRIESWEWPPTSTPCPLYVASSIGILHVVDGILKQGINVNTLGGRYGNALQAACFHGHTETVRLLIVHGVDVDTSGGRYGNALQAASREGHTEIVRLLIERGANVNVQGGYYGNALQAASCGWNIEVVRLLIEHGADVNALGGEYGNALQAASFGGHTEIVRLLIEYGANVSAEGGPYGNALQAAAYRRDPETVRVLIEHGANVNMQGGIYGNALQAAATWGRPRIIRLLIEHGADVNAQGGKYGTAVQAAIYGWSIEVVRILIENGADVNALGGRYGNALKAARHAGKMEIEQLLIEHGAEVRLVED
ncbi:NACHT domain protein [Mycena venus]|uniref:NACHT domain protein n=1 Tax=Mycena venus TaxID=2733690 RepID=A0A8H6XV08_9AGAR|nr:NACHT domain protein [Mycena venus]